MHYDYRCYPDHTSAGVGNYRDLSSKRANLSEKIRNPKQYWESRLRHAISSEYPWHWDISTISAGNLNEWLIETSEITNPVPAEEDMRPLVYAAWAIVMAQYTGRGDACFGISSCDSNGQSSTGIFQVDCEGKMTLVDLVNRVKKHLRGDARNGPINSQEIGFLRNYLAFTPDASSSDTIDVNPPCWPPPAGSALILCFSVKAQSIFLQSHFDSRVVERVEIRRVMGHFLEAFHRVVSPEFQDSVLGTLDLLTSEDKALLQDWNAHVPKHANYCLNTLFDNAAKENREKPALFYRNRVIIYEELDIMSSNLAFQIREGHVSFGNFVPICVEKSPNMVISMLAALKSNKSFVPIDPSHPKGRRDQILKSLQTSAILVSAALHDLFDENVNKFIVSASTLETTQTCQTISRPADFNPEQPAYVLFTSGSTGIPKGVVIEHRNVCTSIIELGRQFSLNGDTRMFQYTSSSFDPAILEIFGTLAYGGCVCIPTEAERLNDITKAMNEMQVNTAVFVPSVLKLLHPKQIPTVKKLIIGGEKLTRPLIDLWAHNAQLINAYGPTETCICSIANLRVAPGKSGSNIGTPVACRSWVVSPQNGLQLMPIGCIGELLIEGPTVARGYLNDQTATEANFTSSLPWVKGGSQRAYQTGDLVRYLPDGKLLFLGRKDKQVKLNGHRIELEEIETHICRSPLIADSTVQLSNINDSSSLIAFLIPEGTLMTDGTDCCDVLSHFENENGHFLPLWEFLRKELPANMVPDYLIPLNCIPRMISGKVDRRRLASVIEQVRLDRYNFSFHRESSKGQEFREDDTVMKGLWAQVLEVDLSSISSSDRFLHLGGNSIKAMKLVSAARSHGLSLTVHDVLKNCTLDDLNRITKPAITRAARPIPQCLSPRTYTPTWIQAVSLTTVDMFPEGNYSRIVLNLKGNLDLCRLHRAVRSLVKQNEILRTQYRYRKDGMIEAITADMAEVPLLRFNSRFEAHEHWRSVPSSFFDQHFVEFSYVVMNEKSTHFSIGLQHSQYDAWTVPLLLRQLQNSYHGNPVFPGPPFSEYAARLPRETNPGAEEFWSKQLADLPMTLIGEGSVESNEPDGQLQQCLRLLPSQFTFATMIYASWALVLSKHANTEKVVFGGAVSGRNIDMDGIQDVVGPCINMVPFAIDIARCATYIDALQAAQKAMIAMVPYEAMPMIDIIQRCTTWNPMDVIGSIVQHLDISFDIPPFPQSAQNPDTLEWRYMETVKRYGRCRATDIYIFSTSQCGIADIQLKFNPSRIQPELAKVLFSDLRAHILAAMQNPEQEIQRLSG